MNCALKVFLHTKVEQEQERERERERIRARRKGRERSGVAPDGYSPPLTSNRKKKIQDNLIQNRKEKTLVKKNGHRHIHLRFLFLEKVDFYSPIPILRVTTR